MLFDLVLVHGGRLVGVLVIHFLLDSGLLLLVHERSLLLDDLFLLHKYLIVLVAIVITHFVLVMRALPLPIHDELVLVEAWSQFLAHSECAVWELGHGQSLLPLIEGTNYLDFVTSVAPNKYGLWDPQMLWDLWLWLFIHLLMRGLHVIVTGGRHWSIVKHLLHTHLWRSCGLVELHVAGSLAVAKVYPKQAHVRAICRFGRH